MADFVFKVQTSGVDDTFTLPLYDGGTYDFNVDWGDSSNDDITAYDDADITHTYATEDEYTVTIDLDGTNELVGFRFNNGGDRTMITDVTAWGDVNLGNVTGWFYGCSNMTVSATDAPDMTGCTTMNSAFRDCSSLTSVAFNSLDVSSVTTFYYCWRDCSSLTSLGDLSEWDVSSVTTFYYCWRDCSSLTSLGDLSEWDVSSVTNFSGCWRSCSSLTSLGDLSEWDVSSVTTFNVCWYGCSSLTSLGDLSEWDVSSVTDFSYCWRSCSSLTSLGDLSEWDVSSVTTFNDCWNNSNDALSDYTYSKMLIAWSALSVESSVPAHFGTADYAASASDERTTLTDAPNSWSITDGGQRSTEIFPALEVKRGTLILAFCDDENAVIKEDISEIYTVVWEDHYAYYIYPEYIIRWRHDTGATTTGFASQPAAAATITGEVSYIPIKYDEIVNRSARLTQRQDIVMAAPTTGDEVINLVIPDDLSSDGFASDGARHLEMDSGELVFTNDITRIGQAIVVHDPPITVDGGSNQQIELIHCDDNAASSTVVADIGNNANWETSEGANRNTDNDDVSEDIQRGTGLDTGGTYHIEHSVTAFDNAYFKQGTINLIFTPQFAYNDAADQVIWSLYVDAGDYLQIVYDAGNDKYELRVSWGATLTTLASAAYTDDVTLQQLTTLSAAWDSDENFLYLAVNGVVVDTGINSGTPSASNAAYVMTGCDCVTDADGTGQLEADVYLDRIEALDGCMIPDSGPFVDMHNSYALPHADVLFYWDGSNCLSGTSEVQIGGVNGTLGSSNTGGTTSFVESGGIFGGGYFDNESDSANYWIKFPSTNIFQKEQGQIFGGLVVKTEASADRIFGIYTDANNFLDLSTITEGAQLYLRIQDSRGGTTKYVGTTGFLFDADEPIFYRYVWKDGDYGSLYINGILIETETGLGSWVGTPGDFYVGANGEGSGSLNGHFHSVTITNDPNTPFWPAILGSGQIDMGTVSIE